MAKKKSDEDQMCPPPPPAPPPIDNLVGLALSGGGIRSASFNLGVLQGLASRRALWMFDYLSTVSGGGFIGSWWSAWLSREGRQAREIFPDPEELEPKRRESTAVLLGRDGERAPVPSLPDAGLVAQRHDPIHFVRLYSNYLTPKKGAFSPDTWRLITFFVRNLLFTWVALLPLLFVAIMVGQAVFLLDHEVGRDFLCAAPPGTPAAAAAVETGPTSYCAGYDLTRSATVVGERLKFLGIPLALFLTAFATLALLWLAHSSARIGLSVLSFTLLGLLGFVILRPLFEPSGGSVSRLLLVIVVLVTFGIHLVQSFLAYRKLQEDGAAGGAAGTRVTAADHRTWLTQQQALLLKGGTVAIFALLVAGFGHDIVWYLFAGDDSLLARRVAKAGGWSAVLLTIGTAVFTAYNAAPTADGSTRKTVGRKSRLVMMLAPPLVLLVLTLGFAFLSHQVLVRTMTRMDNVQVLAKAVVLLAFLDLLFAMYESFQDPVTAPKEEGFGWKRFVPDWVLRLFGLKAPPSAEQGRLMNLFSPRGWVRIGLVGALGGALTWADNFTLAGLWSAITTVPTAAAAAAILGVAGLVTFARRDWKVALGSARPAVLLVIASVAAALGLLGSGASGFQAPAAAPLAAWLWIWLLIGAVIGIGWMVDPNLLSFHTFYKARLTRAYLGASNTARRSGEITDSMPGDDVKLTGLWNHHVGGPYHLINTTLSLVGGSDLAMSQRSAENFIMSRYHCGSARSGYRCTAEYMSGELSLGTAAAVSGAAVSPNMGSKSPSAALALLMSLLNVRLGFWAPTPSGRRWNEPHGRLWPFYVLRETLSNTGTLGTYCYLTDGGHFDNTGLYALVERGCRYIVICDCGADPDRGFEDIGVAIRRCRIDFGAEINLPIDRFRLAEQRTLTDTHVVRGTIIYQRAHLTMLGFPPASSTEGVIVWIKPSVTATNAADVRQYHLEHEDFPQQSTAQQWYDESQFESYRRLGYESARAAFGEVLVIGDFGIIPGLFTPPLPAGGPPAPATVDLKLEFQQTPAGIAVRTVGGGFGR